MNEFFSQIFQSFYSFTLFFSLQLLVILLVRKPVRRWLGAASAYTLWLIPVVCSVVYLFQHLLLSSFFTDALEMPGIPGLIPIQQVLNSSLPSAATNIANSGLTNVDFRVSILGITGVLWLAGIIWILLGFVRKSRALGELLSESVPVHDSSSFKKVASRCGLSKVRNVVLVEDLNAPMLTGVFRHVLVLPSDYDSRFSQEELQLMLTHESIHLKRRDNLWNLIAWMMKTLFWPNPLVHIAYACFRHDQELACDARALQNSNEKQRRVYARALYLSADHATPHFDLPQLSAWGAFNKLRERTVMTRYRTPHPVTRAAGTILMLIISIVLTACMSTPPEPNTLTREVYQHIESLQSARDENDLETAQAELAWLTGALEAGQLNTYESYMTYMYTTTIYSEEGRHEEAVTILGDALELKSLSDNLRKNLFQNRAGNLMQLARYEEAAEDYERALKLAEEPQMFTEFTLANAYVQAEQYRQALPHALDAINLDDGEVSAQQYRLVSTIYRGLQNETKALEYDQLAADAPVNELTFNAAPAQRDYLPVITVPPRYPQSAKDRKLEGWVLVNFTVGTEGEVIEPVVVDSEPPNVFDESALEAIARYKYNPRLEDGEPVSTEGVQSLFRYQLDE